MTEFETRLPAIIDTLAEHGWVVVDDFLNADETDALRHEGERRLAAGEFHRAGVGRGTAQQIRNDVRGDDVRWLDPQAPSTAESVYWQRIASLQRALNRELFMGIRDGEFHYAHYPAGHFYQRHLDRFRDDDARRVSLVCYLNQSWEDGDGGVLRLWPDSQNMAQTKDVLPKGGRLVIFLAHAIWHEVCPATRSRWSLTGWLRT